MTVHEPWLPNRKPNAEKNSVEFVLSKGNNPMIEQFIASQPNQNTKGAYRRGVARFVDWLGADQLGSLTAGEVANFVVYLHEEGFAPKSINQQLSAVRSFLKWAAQQGKVPALVYAEAVVVGNVKEPDTLPLVLTETQVQRLLEQPDLHTFAGSRDYAFLQLSLATGARVSELVGLDIENINWERQEALVDGKGSKQRLVLFDQTTAEALVFWLSKRNGPPQGPLFVNENGARISVRYIQKALASYGTAAGIPGMHPHLLRHYFATRFLDASGDIDATATLLGHADVRTTKVYTRLATSRLRKVYDRVRSETAFVGNTVSAEIGRALVQTGYA